NVARAFVHHLHVLRPRAPGQLALRVQLGKLRLVVCIRDTARPQAIADGKANVVRGHDLADFVPMRVEKTFLMMRQTPLGHDAPSPRNNPCRAFNRSEEHTSELQSLAYL